MDILFEAYGTNDGAGHVQLPLNVFGAVNASFGRVALSLSAHGEGTQINHGTGDVRLPGLTAVGSYAAGAFGAVRLPFDVVGAAGSLMPSLAIGYVSVGGLAVLGTGTQINFGDGNTTLPLAVFGSADAAVGRVSLLMVVYGSDGHVNSDRVALLIQQPELMSSMVLGMTVSLADTFHGVDAQAAEYIHALMDLIRFNDSYGQLAQVLQALHDGIGIADVARLIWEAGLLDTFVASGVQAGTAQITVMLADSIDLSDTATALSEILAGIRDGFYVGLTINTSDDVYTAWVMTPETKAMRSYSNWPFNSYARLGGHFIGACATGIYRMGGDTDDGAAIRASIRTGLLNFGSLNMKAVNRAYLGATLSGSMLLRVQATTKDGLDIEQTYRMTPAVTGKPREHRQDVGRGFRSVYWTFELANDIDGADFEAINWHVLPVTLTGRLI